MLQPQHSSCGKSIAQSAFDHLARLVGMPLLQTAPGREDGAAAIGFDRAAFQCPVDALMSSVAPEQAAFDQAGDQRVVLACLELAAPAGEAEIQQDESGSFDVVGTWMCRPRIGRFAGGEFGHVPDSPCPGRGRMPGPGLQGDRAGIAQPGIVVRDFDEPHALEVGAGILQAGGSVRADFRVGDTHDRAFETRDHGDQRGAGCLDGIEPCRPVGAGMRPCKQHRRLRLPFGWQSQISGGHGRSEMSWRRCEPTQHAVPGPFA